MGEGKLALCCTFSPTCHISVVTLLELYHSFDTHGRKRPGYLGRHFELRSYNVEKAKRAFGLSLINKMCFSCFSPLVHQCHFIMCAVMI